MKTPYECGQFVVSDIKADGNQIIGYGSVFGNRDLGGDIIAKGAFSESLASGRRVRMLRDHDPSKVIGKWTSIEEDDVGLRVKGVLSGTPLGNETASLIADGAIDSMSIGFRAVEADRHEGDRVLKKVELWEISIVTFPMNQLAMIDVAKAASDGNYAPFKRAVERAARDAGATARQAKAAAAAAANEILLERDAKSDGVIEELLAHMRSNGKD